MGDKNTPDCATRGGGDAAWTENFDVLAMNSEAGALTMAPASPLGEVDREWSSNRNSPRQEHFGALVLPFQMCISEKGT